jgi:hypothetical protein
LDDRDGVKPQLRERAFFWKNLRASRTTSLRPQIIYIRDQSNSVSWNYSSTEYWVNVRYAF